jgi:hypothetical protein
MKCTETTSKLIAALEGEVRARIESLAREHQACFNALLLCDKSEIGKLP